MDNGEQRFYLREIYAYWTTPRIVEERLVELEAARLIERCAQPVSMIRLTREGARQKTESRRRDTNSTLSLVRKVKNPQRRPRKTAARTGHQRLT
jgi:hypothetical protein